MKRISELRNELAAVAAVDDTETIDQTARELEGYHYEPTLVFDSPGFIRLDSAAAAREFERIVNLGADEARDRGAKDTDDADRLIRQHLSLFVYHYRLLQRLRRGEAEAWDDVTEVQEED